MCQRARASPLPNHAGRETQGLQRLLEAHLLAQRKEGGQQRDANRPAQALRHIEERIAVRDLLRGKAAHQGVEQRLERQAQRQAPTAQDQGRDPGRGGDLHCEERHRANRQDRHPQDGAQARAPAGSQSIPQHCPHARHESLGQ
jgi:hypothetical protein